MSNINCTNCQTVLPLESVFCKKCGTQLKCKHCGTAREAGANFCISCGEAYSIATGNSERAINRIEFNQKGNSKSLVANFTDEVGVYLASAFNSVVSGNPLPPKNPFKNALQSGLNKSNGSSIPKEGGSSNFEDVDFEEVDVQFDAEIAKIFKQNEDGKLEIIDNRLKEKSKLDKMKRLTVLFIYAKKMAGSETVSREELNDMIGREKLADGAFRSFIGKEGLKYFSKKENGDFALLAGGKEYAEKILTQIADRNFKANPSRAGRKAGKKTSNGANGGAQGGASKSASSNPSAMEMLKKLVEEGYFATRRKLNDIVKYCEEKKATKYSAQLVSVALKRLVKDEVLEREQNEGQYEFWKK